MVSLVKRLSLVKIAQWGRIETLALLDAVENPPHKGS
jgi:hypothetical protein